MKKMSSPSGSSPDVGRGADLVQLAVDDDLGAPTAIVGVERVTRPGRVSPWFGNTHQAYGPDLYSVTVVDGAI